MPRFPACLHDGFVSHAAQCSFPTSSPSLETRTHCFAQYKILAREITVRSGRWTQESIRCSSFPPLSICGNSAWLGRAEAAAPEKNETDFLYYSIRAGDSKALDMRECPLRWLRPGWVVRVILSTRTRAEQNYWLVIVVAVDEAKGLACCFLSHHFHTHLLR